MSAMSEQQRTQEHQTERQTAFTSNRKNKPCFQYKLGYIMKITFQMQAIVTKITVHFSL